MGRTSVLIFWIASLAVISHSKAGIPLSLRCSSRPTLSTISKSPAAPFLAAEPHLSLLPSFIPSESTPDHYAEEIPVPAEMPTKTIVILHKVHRNDDENLKIVITKERKQPTDVGDDEAAADYEVPSDAEDDETAADDGVPADVKDDKAAADDGVPADVKDDEAAAGNEVPDDAEELPVQK
ncbi:uncharacterized protein [Maniola hyperantus]|uniref:uncharacterized protein isoform X2 n=1 Tax=Aphantopus hyperantus TaxID=2795564 RepID=UPI00212EDFE8